MESYLPEEEQKFMTLFNALPASRRIDAIVTYLNSSSIPEVTFVGTVVNSKKWVAARNVLPQFIALANGDDEYEIRDTKLLQLKHALVQRINDNTAVLSRQPLLTKHDAGINNPSPSFPRQTDRSEEVLREKLPEEYIKGVLLDRPKKFIVDLTFSIQLLRVDNAMHSWAYLGILREIIALYATKDFESFKNLDSKVKEDFNVLFRIAGYYPGFSIQERIRLTKFAKHLRQLCGYMSIQPMLPAPNEPAEQSNPAAQQNSKSAKQPYDPPKRQQYSKAAPQNAPKGRPVVAPPPAVNPWTQQGKGMPHMQT